MANNKRKRMMNFFVFVLAVFFVTLISAGVMAACVTPVDDLSVATDTTLCAGTYNLADAGSSGVIIITNNNINLTCNGTVLIGNGSGRGIYVVGRDGITIKGCEIRNYSTALYMSLTEYDMIYNNTLLNNSYGIYGNAQTFSNITANYFDTDVSSSRGIYILSSDDNNISYNTLFGHYWPITLESGSDRNVIDRNNITDGTFNGIYMSSALLSVTFNNVTNNIINSSTNNNYFLRRADNNLIVGNTFDCDLDANYGLWLHQLSNGNNITNNTFINCDAGLFISEVASGNYIYWNNFTSNNFHARDIAGADNEWNTTVATGGIHPEGNYWDDIATLRIFDEDSNNWGDYGTEYPYSAANGGQVSGTDVVDYGPMGPFNTDCVEPYVGMVLTTDTTLCSGTYYLNATGTSTWIIEVNADDINLTCNGTVIIGNNTGYGIYANNDGVVIQNCEIRNFSRGISVAGTDGGTVRNNTLIYTPYGIYATTINDIDIVDNHISQVTLRAIYAMGLGYSNITGNTINKGSISGNPHGIYLYGGTVGDYGDHNNISNNVINGTYYGIYSYRGCLYNTIDSNALNQTVYSIYLQGFDSGERAYGNNITNNNLSTTTVGMGIYAYFENNLFEGNYIEEYSGVTYGFIFQGTEPDNNTIRNNTLVNLDYGVYVQDSSASGNQFYHNNFTGNTNNHAFSTASADNEWNTTSLVGGSHPEGNYWDDTATLLIFDSDANNWGDYGAEYPYNSSWGDVTGDDIQDWGPMGPFLGSCYDGDSDGFGNTSSTLSACTYDHAYDCDDGDANVLPPYPQMIITTDTFLCGGTYYVNSSTASLLTSAIRITSDDVNLTCNGTILVGNGTATGDDAGYGVYSTNDDLNIEGCDMRNYSFGFNMVGVDNSRFYNNSFYNNRNGIFQRSYATNTINNHFESNVSSSSTGITLYGWNESNPNMGDYNNISNNIVYSPDNGIYRGIYLYRGTSWNTIYNNTMIGTSYALDIVGQSTHYSYGNNINANNISSAETMGIRLQHANASNISENYFDGDLKDTTYDIYFSTDADGFIVMNNTFYDSTYGIHINDAGSDENQFYWNNFTNNTVHANIVAGSDNEWNTTVGGEAQGNYWDDTATLRIFDSDTSGDGYNWGDYGSDYPYSAANGASVSGSDVVDYGPMGPFIGACHDDDGDGFGNISSMLVACTYDHAYDCDDGDANVLPPYDDMTITTDTTLCGGTYYINDSGSNGVVIFGLGNINLTCEGTVLIGNATSDGDDAGYGVYADNKDNIAIENCGFRNYTTAIYTDEVDNSQFLNNTLLNCERAIHLHYGSYSNLTDNYADTNVTSPSWGIQVDGLSTANYGNHNRLTGNTVKGFNVNMYIYGHAHHNILDSNIIIEGDLGISLYGQHSGLRPSRNNVTNNDVTSASGSGIRLRYANETLIRNNFVDGDGTDSTYGLYMGDYTQVNTVQNNTFYDCQTGLAINNNNANDNHIYWNTFSSNTGHANVESGSDNEWNTTVCNPTCHAQGNFWDDVVNLQIYDADRNWWGESGPQYPYNATNGANVQGSDVEDWGPYTIPSLPPTVIIQPDDDTVLVGAVLAEAVTGDNTSMMEFYLTNGSGNYALDGTTGSTNDTYGADGWKATIESDNFGEGSYTLTAQAYEGGTGGYSELSSDTLTNIIVDRTSPTGSMMIYGPNGTLSTGSRNVNLNLTFSDTVGVDRCRYANDDAANLEDVYWEECVQVKAWTLSEGYGNKTVYYQIKDLGGNTATYNDSITYQYVVDYTAPTGLVVYDGLSGDDIDWWNENDTIHARWFNATDDISTLYYQYRIWVNDSAPMTSYVDVGTDTSVTVIGLALNESWLYSFEIMAYTSSGLNMTAMSDGVRIDMTSPNPPVINSSTHPDQSTAYALATIFLNWSTSDPTSGGNSSGVEGYSYLMDKRPYTVPDEKVEGYEESAIQDTLDAVEGSGPIKNAGGSVTRASYSQGSGNITPGDTIRIGLRMFENTSETTDLLEYDVFVIKKPASAGSGDFTYDEQANAISNIVHERRDIAHAQVLENARVYYTEVTINDTIGSDEWYVAVVADVDDDDNTNEHGSAGTFDYDNSTKLFVCDELSALCFDLTSASDTSMEIIKFSSAPETEYTLADGTHKFHVRAKDLAGNWGLPSHYNITIYGGGGVDVEIMNPFNGERFVTNSTTHNISVEIATGGNTSVYVVAMHQDGSNHTSDPPVMLNVSNNREYTFENIQLDLGENRIYAVAETTFGIKTYSDALNVTVAQGVGEVTNKTLVIRYSGVAPGTKQHITVVQQAASYEIGMASEERNTVAAEFIRADTSDNPIKIFMTALFDLDAADNLFQDNEFLDMVNPSFGYHIGGSDFVLRNELRFRDIHLGGSFTLPPGKYNLYLRKSGVTTDGYSNVTLVIR